MMLRALAELALAAVTLFLGSSWWQLHKREGFLKRAVSNLPYLEGFISRAALLNPPARLEPYLERSKIGYFMNIDILIKADQRSQRQPKILISGILLLILSGSFYLRSVYFAINLALLLLLGFEPLSKSTESNACEHILTMAVILHRWRTEDPAGCDEWIARAQP